MCLCVSGKCCVCVCCVEIPNLCLCKCSLCAHMPLELLTVTYCKQWRSLCPPFSLFFLCPSSAVLCETLCLYKPVLCDYTSSTLALRMGSVCSLSHICTRTHTHTHSTSSKDQLTALTQNHNDLQHWETSWTLSSQLNSGDWFSEDDD